MTSNITIHRTSGKLSLPPSGDFQRWAVKMSYWRNLLVLVLLQLVAFPLLACSRPPGEAPPTESELFQKAQAVFVAHVYRTAEGTRSIDSSEKPFPVVEGEFRVIEVLKGVPPANGKVATLVPSPGNCAVLMVAGVDYVFFVQEGHDLIWWPDGSQAFTNLQAIEPKKYLERLRKIAVEKPQ